MLDQITPLILTYNEEANIQRTLSSLTWAHRVIVLDSFSSDSTQEICTRFDNVEFHQRAFDSHSKQWQHALDLNKYTPWVLALDADYVLSQELVNELEQLKPKQGTHGYKTKFVYRIDGINLRGSLYPPVITLYKASKAYYQQDGHTQRIVVDGVIEELSAKIFHDDRKTMSRWHDSQKKYALQEARKLSETHFSGMGINDKIRFIGLAPLVVIPYTLIVRGVIFDGLAGLRYTYQRFIAEVYLLKARLGLL